MEWRCPASTKDAQFSLVKRIRLAVWRHSYGDDNLVMRKAAIAPMPAFPPWPPMDLLWTLTALAGYRWMPFPPSPTSWADWSHRTTRVGQLAPAWVQRLLPQPPQGLELNNPILWQPWQVPAGNRGDDNSKALCHHTLGASPTRKGKIRLVLEPTQTTISH